MKRTEKEIADLKSQWCQDPCWDIEETEGFQAHKTELLAYRREIEQLTRQKIFNAVNDRASELQCSFELAVYIIELEQKLGRLWDAVHALT